MSQNQKNTRTLEERSADLARVLAFKIVTSTKKMYGSSAALEDAFRKITGTSGQKSEKEDFLKFYQALSLDRVTYRKILGSEYDGSGKRIRWITLDDVLPHMPPWLHRQSSFTKRFKSGKSFAVRSYWYIDFDKLEELLSDERWLDFSCREIYTKRQRDLIVKHVLRPGSKETREEGETEMTKADREQYQKEYEEGKRMLPLEEAIKLEAKKKRAADKHRATVVKNATAEVIGDYKETLLKCSLLEKEVQDLKREVQELTHMNTSLEAELAECKQARSQQEVDPAEITELKRTLGERDQEIAMLREDLESLDAFWKKREAAIEKKERELGQAKLDEGEVTRFEKALKQAVKREEVTRDSEPGSRAYFGSSHPDDDIPEEALKSAPLNSVKSAARNAPADCLDGMCPAELAEKIGLPAMASEVHAGHMNPKDAQWYLDSLDLRWPIKLCRTGFSPSKRSIANHSILKQLLPKALRVREAYFKKLYEKCA